MGRGDPHSMPEHRNRPSSLGEPSSPSLGKPQKSSPPAPANSVPATRPNAAFAPAAKFRATSKCVGKEKPYENLSIQKLNSNPKHALV